MSVETMSNGQLIAALSLRYEGNWPNYHPISACAIEELIRRDDRRAASQLVRLVQTGANTDLHAVKAAVKVLGRTGNYLALLDAMSVSEMWFACFDGLEHDGAP